MADTHAQESSNAPTPRRMKLPQKFRESCERKGVSPREIKKFTEIVNSLYDESARARALIASEWLSEALEKLLRARFKATATPGPKQDFLLKGHAPFASLFMRIEVCAAFGLISHDNAEQMHAVREVRNHCAHATTAAKPEDQEMSEKVRLLRGAHLDLESEPASMVVVLATAKLVGAVYATRKLLTQRPQRKRQPKP